MRAPQAVTLEKGVPGQWEALCSHVAQLRPPTQEETEARNCKVMHPDNCSLEAVCLPSDSGSTRPFIQQQLVIKPAPRGLGPHWVPGRADLDVHMQATQGRPRGVGQEGLEKQMLLAPWRANLEKEERPREKPPQEGLATCPAAAAPETLFLRGALTGGPSWGLTPAHPVWP